MQNNFDAAWRQRALRGDPDAVHSLVADRSQLLPGESDEIDIWIDRATRTVRVRSGANEIKLQVQP